MWQVKVKSDDPCIFPFTYKNQSYTSCTKKDKEQFWCATTVNDTNHSQADIWGYCNNLCHKEDKTLKPDEVTLKPHEVTLKPDEVTLKPDEVTLKSWLIQLVVGILVSVLFIIALIIIYICLKKKKSNTPENAKLTNEYALDTFMNGDQARINSTVVLNEKAAHLSYRRKYEIEESKFEIGKKIGGGSFGSVYEGILTGQNIKVAIKSVNDSLDRSQVFALMCEIKVLDKLDKHINLVNMIGACTAQQNSGKIWLILEYCPCGDMKIFLNKNSDVFIQDLNNQVPHKILNARLFIKWAYDIVKGMAYLSLKNIMHGDLAARNILISNSDNENYLAKVTDFGLSKAFYDQTSYKKQDRKNVPWKWMDVDYLKTGIFKNTSDVWSFGVVFWEMLSIGQVPYLGGNAKDTIKEIKAGYRLPPPDEIAQVKWLIECYNEVTKMCWHLNPKQRSSFSDLVETFENYLTTEEKDNNKTLEQYLVKDETKLQNEPSKGFNPVFTDPQCCLICCHL